MITLHGDFQSAPTDQIAARLRALGAQIARELESSSTHIVLGQGARRLSTLLGKGAIEIKAEAMIAAGHSLRVLGEEDLADLLANRASIRVSQGSWSVETDAVCAALATGSLSSRISAVETLAARADPATVPSLVAAVTAEAPHDLVVAVTRALVQIGGEQTWRFLAERIADARLSDRALRTRVALVLENRGDAEALAALGSSVMALRGTMGTEDAAAFGRLVAKGVTRWGYPSPVAIEFEAGRGGSPAALITLARRAGVYETLIDERGVWVHRVRFSKLDRPPATPFARGSHATTDAKAPPAYALLALASRRRGSRVWFAGLAFPASLPWAVWLALFDPVATRDEG